MKFCQPHWDALREAIKTRGLDALVSETGEAAVLALGRQLQGEDTVDTFDPLMYANFAILSNALETVASAGGSPSYFNQADDVPEDPVDVEVYGTAGAGRTWPHCPVCYLSLAHELSCGGQACDLPKVNGYDWMIDRGADDALEKWKSYRQP